MAKNQEPSQTKTNMAILVDILYKKPNQSLNSCGAIIKPSWFQNATRIHLILEIVKTNDVGAWSAANRSQEKIWSDGSSQIL